MTVDELSPDFLQQVKTALAALYDLPALQRHPLARQASTPGDKAVGEGVALRRALLESIEALNPGPAAPFLSPQARPYHLLHLHYVEGLPILETGRELSLSERQTYRDLRQAEQSLAVLLWSRWQQTSQQMPSAPTVAQARRVADLTSADEELARWAVQAVNTDLAALVRTAAESVARLAAEQGVTVELVLPDDPLPITADPALARQVLVQVLSHVVRGTGGSTGGSTVTVTLPALPGNDPAVVVRCPALPGASAGPAPAVQPLLERLGWEVQVAPGEIIVRTATSPAPAVLVIDDNEGLTELLDRYLTEQGLRVLVATGGAAGLHLAQAQRPAAIILDVMMPGIDGWELLQRLHTDLATAAIPVVVCSFIHDPDLARSLGAALFLPKPVRRDQVLDALRRVIELPPSA